MNTTTKQNIVTAQKLSEDITKAYNNTCFKIGKTKDIQGFQYPRFQFCSSTENPDGGYIFTATKKFVTELGIKIKINVTAFDTIHYGINPNIINAHAWTNAANYRVNMFYAKEIGECNLVSFSMPKHLTVIDGNGETVDFDSIKYNMVGHYFCKYVERKCVGDVGLSVRQHISKARWYDDMRQAALDVDDTERLDYINRVEGSDVFRFCDEMLDDLL